MLVDPCCEPCVYLPGSPGVVPSQPSQSIECVGGTPIICTGTVVITVSTCPIFGGESGNEVVGITVQKALLQLPCGPILETWCEINPSDCCTGSSSSGSSSGSTSAS